MGRFFCGLVGDLRHRPCPAHNGSSSLGSTSQQVGREELRLLYQSSAQIYYDTVPVRMGYAAPVGRGEDTDLADIRSFLPILVSLGELLQIREKNDTASFPKLLSDLYPDLHVERLFKEVLDEGKGLLLLDGLDEIAEGADRLKMARYLDACMTRFGQNRFVITSRIAGFDEIFFPGK